MNVLILGSGGREHAIAKKLKQSSRIKELHCLGSNINPGLLNLCDTILTQDISSHEYIQKYIKQCNITLTVVGPEAPLETGIAEACWEVGCPCIGPLSNYARIETSKFFTRELMRSYDIPGQINCFSLSRADENFFDKLINSTRVFSNNYVVKYDGLKGGKGVKVYGEHLNSFHDTYDFVKTFPEDRLFLIEEKKAGSEFSLISFCDGNPEHTLHAPLVRDHKRAYIGDKGPNTGGMGSYTCSNHLLPDITEKDKEIAENINKRVLIALNTMYEDSFSKRKSTEKKGKSPKGYVGILYGSFMKTTDGEIVVIEYNSRFGDPECINLLEIMETDLLDVFMNMTKGTLNKVDLKFKNVATVAKYLVPNGYPDKPIKGSEIHISNSIRNKVLTGAIHVDESGKLIMTGSRTACVIETGDTTEEASLKVEKIIKKITTGNECLLYHRKDIGHSRGSTALPKEGLTGHSQGSVTYESAGVNIEEGNKVVTLIKKMLPNIGDYGGLYPMYKVLKENQVLQNYSLVASTDGVGTKVVLATLFNDFGTIGHDLVNHCINDILVMKAIPLFFTDYVASDTIKAEQISCIVASINDACKEHGISLVGGETAEMKDVYVPGHVDVVGNIVGITNIKNLKSSKNAIKPGDIVIGLPSSGLHTNGYTLVRKIFTEKELEEYKEVLLTPHKCYLNEINELETKGINIKQLCHITGGGFVDNPPRILKKNLKMVIKLNSWRVPNIFSVIQRKGNVPEPEMLRTFNCGIGMMLIVSRENANLIKETLKDSLELGRIASRKEGEDSVEFTK